MSLRKEKAARLKLAILDEAHRLIGKKAFQDLFVEDICGRVKISKVTFFKYFPQKEDVLLYHFRLWCIARSADQKKSPRTGLAGIYFLSDKVADDMDQYPGIWMSLIGYLADLKRSHKPIPVKPEEKKWFLAAVPDADKLEIQSLEVMLESFVLEAIFRKEITRNTSTREITHLLASTLYGSVLTAHLLQQSPAKLFFRKNLDLILKGLG